MNKLKIDEIIDHCKRKTKAYEQLNGIKELESADISNTFIREYWEHRQVAEYLEELKQYRAIGTVEECLEAVEMKRRIAEIVNQQLIAGKDNYKEVYNCFYDIVKVMQAHV